MTVKIGGLLIISVKVLNRIRLPIHWWTILGTQVRFQNYFHRLIFRLKPALNGLKLNRSKESNTNNWIFGYGPMPALDLEKYILPIFSLSAVIICFFLQMFIQVNGVLRKTVP